MSAPFLGNETEISGREKQPAAIRKQNHRYKSPHRRILRLDTGQHVYQLKLSRCMSVFRSRFIRVRMDNRHSIDYMRVCEQRNTAYVRIVQAENISLFYGATVSKVFLLKIQI